MFHRVGEGAWHDGGALAADIGQSVSRVQAGIFQKPIVAGVAAKRMHFESFGRASANPTSGLFQAGAISDCRLACSTADSMAPTICSRMIDLQ